MRAPANHSGTSLRAENGEARRYLRMHLTATQDRTAVDGLLLQELHRIEARVDQMSQSPEDKMARGAVGRLEARVQELESTIKKLLSLPSVADQLKAAATAKIRKAKKESK